MTHNAVPSSRKLEYLGDPTLARVMRRPQWILALLLALVVAGVFAWLGQWQLDNAIRMNADESVEALETLRPLDELAEPGVAVTEAAAGAVVETTAAFRADDLLVVAPRQNGGETGAWVVAHARVESPAIDTSAHLAVAVGWAPDITAAEAAIDELASMPEWEDSRLLEGRFMPTEGAVVPVGADPSLLQTMVPAQLVNIWSEVDGPGYGAYLVLHPTGESASLIADAGLDVIDSVAPEPPEAVNWLNVFYAIEWVVFAGFAVFLWYRLTRDAWEKEHEMLLLQAEARAAEASGDGDAAEPQQAGE